MHFLKINNNFYVIEKNNIFPVLDQNTKLFHIMIGDAELDDMDFNNIEDMKDYISDNLLEI